MLLQDGDVPPRDVDCRIDVAMVIRAIPDRPILLFQDLGLFATHRIFIADSLDGLRVPPT
ncbi:hypothetical protein PTKU15_85130 [Paraburkholderia terrae]|nr:hypothetical protein PTKU15_85130 [Paraburkholderia terrae]